MCGPLALTVAATAMTAAGQLQSGLYAQKVARNQAMVAMQNKALVRENTADTIARGQDDQRQLGREIAERVGSQTARMAGSNVDVTSGSAARLIADTRMIGAEDSRTLTENLGRQVYGQQIDAWGFESESRAKRAEAKQAMTATAFGIGSTILGGAVQFSKFRASYGSGADKQTKIGQKKWRASTF